MARRGRWAVVLCAGVALACGSRKADPDAAPTIDGIVVSPEVVAPGGTVTVAASAADPDGAGLRYAWAVPAGWVVREGGDGPALTLWAPAVTSATAALVLTVTDPGGRSATRVALVRTAPSSARPAVTFTSILAQPNPVAPGGSADVAAVAGSADGAAITYRAEVSDPDWAVQADGSGARVSAPSAYDRTATVTLYASGATGGSAVARVLVATKPWSPPTIDALVASPTVTSPGGRVQLSAAAHGADGIPVSYAWTLAGTGWSLTANGATATATAPAAPSAGANVAVTVTDAAGASAGAAIVLSTSDAIPVLDALAAQPTPVSPGGLVTASALAQDPTGAPLQYAWSVAPAEWTVAAASGGTASIRAPIRYGAVGVLTVTATGRYAATTGTVLLSTDPYTAPQIASVLAAPSALAAGGTAQLAVTAASPDGLPLTYAWSVAAAGWSVAGSGPDAVLAAPKARGQAAIVAVDVTDAAGATARGTVVVSTLP